MVVKPRLGRLVYMVGSFECFSFGFQERAFVRAMMDMSTATIPSHLELRQKSMALMDIVLISKSTGNDKLVAFLIIYLYPIFRILRIASKREPSSRIRLFMLAARHTRVD